MFFSDAALDPKYAPAVRQIMERTKRAHLADFLHDQSAQVLLNAMPGLDWRLITNAGGKTHDLNAEQLASMDQRKLVTQLHEEARNDFRFMYDGYRLSEACLSGAMLAGPLVDFFATMNDEPALKLFRAMTGDDRIVYLDMMVSRYRPGHFLTVHNDEQDDGYRLYAFVFNFSREWKADWGGLLAFHDADGHIAEAYTPRWGALNIFKVPQWHAVTMVTPAAAAGRYSITGWMRSRRAVLSPEHPGARAQAQP